MTRVDSGTRVTAMAMMTVCDSGSEAGHQQDRQDQRREREQHVHEPLADQVEAPAEVARAQAPDEADGVAEEHRGQGDQQRDARAVNDPAQHVPPQVVGAEPVGGTGGLRIAP